MPFLIDNQAKQRNYIINGNFDFWQRGTSNGTATGGRYLADRWRVESAGTTTSNDRIAFTPGQTAVPGEPTYNNQITVNSVVGANNYCLVEHYVEDARTLAGQTATLTFWAKASAARNIVIEFSQGFGSGGSPSSSTSFGTTMVALTTTYAKYTVTVNVPSIAGKTFGTSPATSFLAVYIWLDAGTNLNSRVLSMGQQGSAVYNFASVSLVQGSISPTAFQLAGGSMAGELAACQRYYEKSYDVDVAPGTSTYNGANTAYVPGGTVSTGEIYMFIPFKVPKKNRTWSSVTFYSLNGTPTQAGDYNSAVDRGVNSAVNAAQGVSGMAVFTTAGSNFSAAASSHAIAVHWAVDAEF